MNKTYVYVIFSLDDVLRSIFCNGTNIPDHHTTINEFSNCHCEDTYMDVGGTSSWTNEVDHVRNNWSRQRQEQAVEEQRSNLEIAGYEFASATPRNCRTLNQVPFCSNLIYIIKEPLNKSWLSRQILETVKCEAQSAGNIGNISKFCNEVVGCLRGLNTNHGLVQRFLKYICAYGSMIMYRLELIDEVTDCRPTSIFIY